MRSARSRERLFWDETVLMCSSVLCIALGVGGLWWELMLPQHAPGWLVVLNVVLFSINLVLGVNGLRLLRKAILRNGRLAQSGYFLP